jgi:diguanylate cyclase (GGDEF)-like protein
VSRPDGSRVWLEVGAAPFLHVPELDFVALVLRPWEAQHHLGEFLTALLADAPLAEVLVPLTSSISAVVDGLGAAVHHGFDGASFVGATCSWPDGNLPLDAGPWCEAASDGITRWLVDPDGCGPLGARGCWIVPLLGGTVAPATVTVWREEAVEPLVGHRHALSRWTSFVRLALIRTAEHQRLRHLAGHDALTGVANRASFRDRLAGALAIGERDLAVAFCDLDAFKPVNDTYGHQVGDDVLVEVAARLRQQLRVGDELARIGGDEFTVLMRNVPDTTTAGHVADRLLGAVAQPFAVPGGEVRIGLSVGVALAGSGATADGLLTTADAALYACKRAGGGRRAVVG